MLNPALRPAHGTLKQPLCGGCPSLHPLRTCLHSRFVRELLRYYSTLRLPGSVHPRLTSLDFPRRPAHPLAPRANPGSPGSRTKCFQACSGSPTAQSLHSSRLHDQCNVAFRMTRFRRRSVVLGCLSRLNTRPACSPRQRFVQMITPLHACRGDRLAGYALTVKDSHLFTPCRF
jgi:hypothetical protein